MQRHVQVPQDPVKIALIGAGARSTNTYKPLLGSLASWITLVAVCDPVEENCDELADEVGVPAFYDIRELVKARPMDAALVVTPVESHHSISVCLASDGIHNLTETTRTRRT